MDEKLKKIQKLLDVSEGNLQSARNLLREYLNQSPSETLDITAKLKDFNPSNPDTNTEEVVTDSGTIVEGIFNGTEMIGPDGKAYIVPANYASKSKLVEGDGLKLTISEDGSHIYKQISPVERRNIIGTLSYNNGQYTVDAEGKTYRVLTASVTFYKAQPGDQVSIIIPRAYDSSWATLENVIKKQESDLSNFATPEPQIVMPENSVKITAVDYDNETIEPTSMSIAETPAANKLVVNDLDNPVNTESLGQTNTDNQPEMVLPEEHSVAGPAILTTDSLDTAMDIPENTAETITPPVTAPNQDLGPEIEFPAGPTLSDDEILAKLKANISGNQQIVADTQANTGYVSAPANEVAADLNKIMQQQSPRPKPADTPISELDI